MHVRISCFLKLSPTEQTYLSNFVTRMHDIEAEVLDASGTSESDSIVCMIHLGSGETCSETARAALAEALQKTLASWAATKRITTMVNFSNRNASAPVLA